MEKNAVRSYLSCAVFAVAITPIGGGFRAIAQTPSADLSFEVATVKPVDPSHFFNPYHFWAHVNPAGASYWSMTPTNLIVYAYGVESFQVAGPEWTNADRFDIEARFPMGADKKDDQKMLQALLKDRFKLAFHIEKRQFEGYVLVVGKHGERLRPSLPGAASPEAGAPSKPADTSAGGVPAQPKITKNPDDSSTVDMGKGGTVTVTFDRELWALHYERSKITMGELAVILGSCLGSGEHNVVDETGIKGTYQLAWDCPLAAQQPSTNTDADGTLPSDPHDGYALRRSLDALGLKLEKRETLQDSMS